MKIKKCCKNCKNKGQICSCYLADQCFEYVDDDSENTELSCSYQNYVNYRYEGNWKW